jgi:hypothetical protein
MSRLSIELKEPKLAPLSQLALHFTPCSVAPQHGQALTMPVVLGDLERWLNLDTTLDDVDPLKPERFAVRAVNKVSEKNIDAIERAA